MRDVGGSGKPFLATTSQMTDAVRLLCASQSRHNEAVATRSSGDLGGMAGAEAVAREEGYGL